MKKKLFRSFIVSLFVFTLFISVSKAELVPNTLYKSYSYNSTSNATYVDASSKIFGDYKVSQIITRLTQAYNGDFTALDNLINEIESAGQKVLVLKSSSETRYRICIWDGSGIPTMQNITNGIGTIGFLDFFDEGVEQIQFYGTTGNSGAWFLQLTTTKPHAFVLGSNVESIYYCSVPIPIVTLEGSSNSTYKVSWDGTSYFYQSAPLGPELPELTGEEMKSMIDKLRASEAYKSRLPAGYGDFFIVYNSVVDNYYAYVYPTKYNLAYRYYDWTGSTYVANGLSSGDAINFMQYDPNKGLSWQKLWDAFVDTLFPFDYYCFRLSSDGETFLYSTQYEINDPAYFDTTEEHIIYSSKRMYLLVNSGVLGTEVDEENSIKQTILKDSSGNDIEVSINESEEYNPVVEALNRKFKELASFIEFVLNGVFNFSDFLLKTFGENVFTLIFSIIIEAFSALVAGISLLVRFAGFVLTLVAIPADSSLFNVLVDGSAWGTHFIEGLNFLKGLSWNNLNLWTFFECFVAALEVIWTVRIVRRHYSQVV